MKSVCIIAVVALVVTVQGSFLSSRKSAKLGQFPWIVSVRIEVIPGEDLRHACSGGILNPNWVVTSAHCLFSGLERVVVAGIVRKNDEGDQYCIVRTYPHPMYDMTNSNWHDIGLLKVEDMTFNKQVQPIALAREAIDEMTPAVIVGFGDYFTNLTDVQSSLKLNYRSTTIVTNLECTTKIGNFPTAIYPGHLCTLNRRGVGGCFSETGSTLVTKSGLAAIVSFGVTCDPGLPDVLVRVSHYTRWINLQILMWS